MMPTAGLDSPPPCSTGSGLRGRFDERSPVSHEGMVGVTIPTLRGFPAALRGWPTSFLHGTRRYIDQDRDRVLPKPSSASSGPSSRYWSQRRRPGRAGLTRSSTTAIAPNRHRSRPGPGDGARFFQAAAEFGLEGIVSKRATSQGQRRFVFSRWLTSSSSGWHRGSRACRSRHRSDGECRRRW